MNDTQTRNESRLEVQTYLQILNYALEHGATITFQENRKVDLNRNIRYTNRYTISDLFPNENPTSDVYIKLRVELLTEFGNHTVFVMSFHYAEKPFT